MASAAASSRSRVFSAYRRLFRARAKLFGADTVAMAESRNAIRTQFQQNKGAPTSGEHFEGLLTMVDEAEDMLLHGFVQGTLNPDSQHYEVKIKPEHTSGDMANVPQLEPVTEKVVQELENPGAVEVTCTHAAKKNSS